MRAVSLRFVLLNEVKHLTSSYTQAYQVLSSLTSPRSPLSPSTAELARHEAEAEQDRLDAIRREQAYEALVEHERRIECTHMRLSRSTGADDGFSSVAMGRSQSDSIFGGIERQRSLVERGPNATIRRHRIRPSVGTAGAFGIGTAADSKADALVTPTRVKRRRPASLGVWPGQSLAYALRDTRDDSIACDNAPSTPIRSSASAPSQPARDTDISLVSVQDAFETMHDVRRTVIWEITTLADHAIEEETWEAVRSSLKSLTTTLNMSNRRIVKAVREEFGDTGLGSSTLAPGRSAGVRVSKRTPSFGSDFKVGPSTPARSIGGSSLAPSPTLKDSSSAIALADTSSRPTAQRYRDTLSNASDSFAPPGPAPTQQALAVFEERNAAISLALRSVAAKTHVVSQDARRIVSSGRTTANQSRACVDLDRLLATHESVRADLDALLQSWEDSRAALRTVLRARDDPPYLSPDAGNDDDHDSHEGSTSLDSIADDEHGLVDDMTLQNVLHGDVHFESAPEYGDADHGAASRCSEVAVCESFAPEVVFEATAGQTGKDEKAKLTREERIKMMKAARDGKKEPVASQNVDIGLVSELKDVLGIRGQRRQLVERNMM